MQSYIPPILVALVAIPSIAAGETTIDDVCIGIYNAHECSAAIETSQLPLWKGRVARVGTMLVLTLGNGEVIELEDDRYSYRFRECNAAAGKCVFVKGANEHVSYVVVDVVTGRHDEYRGIVTYSPGGATFVVAGLWSSYGGSSFLEIRDTSSDVTEFLLDSTALITLAGEFAQSAVEDRGWSAPQAGQARWVDDNTVSFTLWWHEGAPGGASMPLTLLRADAGWRIGRAP